MKMLVLAVLVLLTACVEKTTPPVAQPQVVLVHLVHLGAGTNQAEYSGEIKPRHETALGFRVAGKMIERRVEVGDLVAQGHLLARLDSADLAQARHSAEAQLAATEAERLFARAEAERYRTLKNQQFVSQAALDAKETALRSSEEKVRSAVAQNTIAANQAGYAVLTSSDAGVVSAVLAEAGQVVAAGQPVIKLARIDEKEVLISLPESRVGELNAAGEVSVTLWAAPDRRYRGRVREISPQADPVTRTYAVRIAIQNADANVRLGMTAKVLLAHTSGESVTLIPASSVFQQGKQPAVWQVAADGRVHLQKIQVVGWREDGVAINGGLVEGERIVAAGVHKLSEGETVRVAEGRQ